MTEEKLEEVYQLTKNAYDAEYEQKWELAYDLHNTAKNQWTAFAGTARTMSTGDQVLRRMAERRAELHVQRMNTLQPFTKDGKQVPKMLIMHPSERLTKLGLSELVDLEQMATAEKRVEETMPLTLV